MNINAYFFGLLLIICGNICYAQELLVLKEGKGYEVTYQNFSVYNDSSEKLKAPVAISQQFTPVSSYSFSPNQNPTYWFKAEIIDSSQEEKDWFFTFYKYTIDSIDFFVMKGDTILKSGRYSVYTAKMSEREIGYKNFSLDLAIPKNQKITILLRSHDRDACYFGYAIKDHKFYISYAVEESFYFGLFYGAMVLIIVYHLSFLWSLRDPAYLFYILYILFQSIYMTFRDGTIVSEVLPELPQLVRPSFAIITIFLSVSLLMYARYFLRLNNYKWFDIIVKIYIPVRIVSYIIHPEHTKYHTVLDYFPVFIAFVFSMVSMLQKHQTSYLLCIGFSFLIAAHSINTLWQNNIIECTPQVFYSMYVGLMIESVLLALANAYRLNVLKQDSLKKLELENLKIKDELKINQQETIIVNQREQIDNFLYRASHDIKGPLKTIDGLSRLGLMDVEDSAQYFSRIQIMTSRLQKIVDNFLEVVRNNNSEVKNEVLNINTLVRQCVDEQFSEYPGRGQIKINVAIPEGMEVYSEYYSLYSVIQNLIENAIKYQDSAKPEKYIMVSANELGEDCVIIVEDNGQGISDSSKEKIFSMFYRANTDNAEGVGMGLYIVKQALDRIKATIRIESEEGAYSRFIIQLARN